MNTRIISSFVCLVLPPVVVCARDERPVLKESPEKLIALIQTMAEENVEMARFNVAHDVIEKRLRIFSTAAIPKAGESKISDYRLEIIQVSNAATFKNGVGSYRFQNNNALLAFAAAQFASGDKAFAKRLVDILAEAEPGLFWSTPTHPVMTIQQISASLQKDDDTGKEFLEDYSQEWTKIVRKYGS